MDSVGACYSSILSFFACPRNEGIAKPTSHRPQESLKSRSIGVHRQREMFDYFDLFEFRAGAPSHTLDSSALAGPAFFLSFIMLASR